MPYSLFAIGNPLLDIQIDGQEAEDLLKKYNLKANDAILASEEHAPIYDELIAHKKVVYVAGGAAQNTARGAAYILPPSSVFYTGCVGDDILATQLQAANEREGLKAVYQVKKGDKTGACAVVITGNHRSLVTTLRSAEKFEQSHLSTPEVAKVLEEAKVIYTTGFFLTHGIESALSIVSKPGKTVVFNISAPFIAQFFGENLLKVLAYVDYVICNESEAEAWGAANNVSGSGKELLQSVAKALAALPKTSPGPRTSIITHGSEQTIWVSSESSSQVHSLAVDVLSASEIVDTNGAGDAFAGGFVAALIKGKSTEEAVGVGHKMGRMCVQQVGPQFAWPKVQVL